MIGTIIVNNLVYRDHSSLKLRGVPKDVRSHDIERVRSKEQLSTRVGCGRVHPIIENDLDKCRVVAPNLPTKTDDLSHSTGHGWTTREKRSSHYVYSKKVDIRPLRNLRELRLGTPRVDKALSDHVETNDHVRPGHVKGPRALSSENNSPTTRLGARKSTRCLYGSTPQSTKASTKNVDKPPSQILRLLHHSRTKLTSDMDGVPDKERQPEFYMHGFEEKEYPVVDYKSDLLTAMSTTVR
ncbi:ulp1 protease-like protein [Oryza sativa Japonica Group]|uniref:Ulp1 protease-like protein n=2 Tax=Oryza sativa subsp. japonica TaxID=39947 RepID=Q5ZBF1_ORYSJ|nr:ulp1 protease-like protein [Oryza sativa Japonica Group]BAD53181.1 ulp1 protease-like protein [Oryza sativa Japonica Group]